MFGLSAGHLLIVALVALLFGAKRLPELGASLGKGIRAFKGAVEGQPFEDVARTLPEAKNSTDSASQG